MKACAWCGRENNLEAAFCRECGTKFSRPSPAPTQVPAEDPAVVGDQSHVSKRPPRPILGWISLVLAGSLPLVVLWGLDGPSGPDEITGGLGGVYAVMALVALLALASGGGFVAGLFGLWRCEQPRWPARIGVVLGGVTVGLIACGLLYLVAHVVSGR